MLDLSNNCDKQGKKRVYYGETSRNPYIRSKEHYADVIKKKESSWIYKHIKKESTLVIKVKLCSIGKF